MPPAAPVEYPLGPPVYSNDGQLTVDVALDQPTRITRRLQDITLQRFIVDRLYARANGVTGGAVVYDQALANELYLTRDVEQVAPGAEFPLVASQRSAPKVAQVEKWGGKFFVTDEARERNSQTTFDNQVTQLANTIERKVNTRAVAELNAAMALLNGAGDLNGRDWGSVSTAGPNTASAEAWPAADFADAQLAADVEELGVTFDLWLLNPVELAQLRIVYGDRLQDILDTYDIELFGSNRVPRGIKYAVASGQVGEYRLEQALGTETWREPETERTWVQSSVRPVMYVTNPFAIKRVNSTGV